MLNRRRLLIDLGVVSAVAISGCLETFTGGSFSDGVDASQLAAERGEVVQLYDEAITERNDGVRTRDDAIRAFNDESYDGAIERFETAIEHFEAAKQGFGEAADLAFEVGEDEAGAICETSEEDAELQVAATEAALTAAEAADGEGTAADVNGHVEEYQNLVEQAEEVPVEEPQTLADVIQSG